MSAPDSQAQQWIQVVPWVIALVGLAATHLFSEARERRKEFRAQLDKLVERLLKLEETGRKFHTSAAFDREMARNISSEISRLERVVHRLGLSEDLAAVVIEHRQAFTLLNFDSEGFVQQAADSELVAGLADVTIEYEEALESAYRDQHPRTFPYYRILPANARSWHEVGRVLVGVWVGALIVLAAVVVYKTSRG